MGVNCKCMKEDKGKSTLVLDSAMLELEGVSCTAYASSPTILGGQCCCMDRRLLS